MNQPDFGNELAKIRKAKGLTQAELAQKCDVSYRTIQRIESGKVSPRIFTIKTLSVALDYDFLKEFSVNLSINDKFEYQGFVLINKIIYKTIDLFNLKTNAMRKLSVLTVVFGLIGIGLFSILKKSNAQDSLKFTNFLTIESNESITKKEAIDIIEKIYNKAKNNNGAVNLIKNYVEKSEYNFDTYVHLSKLIASFGYSTKPVKDIAEIVYSTHKECKVYKDIASLIFLNEGTEVMKYVHLAQKVKEASSEDDLSKIRIEIENYKIQAKYKTLDESYKNQEFLFSRLNK
jgi:transcriptional regulator with XRE-family HTH domain